MPAPSAAALGLPAYHRSVDDVRDLRLRVVLRATSSTGAGAINHPLPTIALDGSGVEGASAGGCDGVVAVVSWQQKLFSPQ